MDRSLFKTCYNCSIHVGYILSDWEWGRSYLSSQEPPPCNPPTLHLSVPVCSEDLAVLWDCHWNDPPFKTRFKPSTFPQQLMKSYGHDRTTLKHRKISPFLNRRYIHTVAGRLWENGVLNKCLLSSCNGTLLLLFSESQESTKLFFFYKIWPSFIFLGGNEFMAGSLEWTNKNKK